jgi:SWI/SNF-related matrix-associated actin-dependent regulator of chromatin subfamily A3
VTLGPERTVVAADNTVPLGRLSKDADDCLRALLEDVDIELQLYCKLQSKKIPRRRNTAKAGTAAQLMIIVYGEFDRFDDIDSFCNDSGIFLQDPTNCDRAVEYRNPHRLSSLDAETILTSSIPMAIASSECASASVDLLKGFENGESLPEMNQPPALRTALHKHQKQALTFMTKREEGWLLDCPTQDVWSRERRGVGTYR